MKNLLFACALLLALLRSAPVAQTASRLDIGGTNLPDGYWPEERSRALLEKTVEVRLAPDTSYLTEVERQTVARLIEVGKIFQSVYEEQRHADALESYAALTALDRRLGSPQSTRNLLTLYRLFQGPIGTTLDNKREPFLPVELTAPGAAMYDNATKEEVEAFLAAHPDKRDSILDQRTAVRRAVAANLSRDLGKLRQYPVLDTLHPGLRKELEVALARPDAKAFYAVPYSVAWADEMVRAHALLSEAADAVEKDDWEFARYLRNRARDLLSDDYESGDAAWVTGRFKNLNAQIGAYETYDDALYGVKTFFSFSIFAMRRDETDELRRALKGLQALEDSLPYEHHKRVRQDIPIYAFDVVADFGQSRGGNTAIIFPNETFIARRYGRILGIRYTILWNQQIFEGVKQTWEAAVLQSHEKELTGEGNANRLLWHEVGHYLGVEVTKDGRDLDVALQDDADLLEEMKADLISLYLAEPLRQQGYYYSDTMIRAVYASGVLRVLQNVKPRRDQPFQTMQLMQWNYFMEHGLLSFDHDKKLLRINYDKYRDVVGALLARVLEVQYQGDKAAADRFIDEYAKWDESLHGAIAANIRARQRYRFRLFKYARLDG